MTGKLKETIANQCAQVLMDVKPSNLLILKEEEQKDFLQMEHFSGISCICLYKGEEKSSWLLYRKDRLEAILLWPQVQQFLAEYGYLAATQSLEEMLERLAQRFTAYKKNRISFPHELGIFFGYPLEDVKGFIEHQGKDYLCSGYWKVYHNEQKARHTFWLYQNVKEKVLQMVYAGRSLYEISYLAS